MYYYLSNRKPRVKVGEAYSSLRELLYGVPHFVAVAVQYFPL